MNKKTKRRKCSACGKRSIIVCSAGSPQGILYQLCNSCDIDKYDFMSTAADEALERAEDEWITDNVNDN